MIRTWDDALYMLGRERRACLEKARLTPRKVARSVARRRGRREGIWLAIYRCRYCGGFHLTNGPLRVAAS